MQLHDMPTLGIGGHVFSVVSLQIMQMESLSIGIRVLGSQPSWAQTSAGT